MDWVKQHFKHKSDSKFTNTDHYKPNVYHEKQIKELCALHALNNLFQSQIFNKQILDEICIELSPQDLINPHRSILGRGNYNINVIMRAVQLKDHEAVWFDKRRPISTLNFSVIKGFILNVPSDYKFGGIISLPWERKHWIAVTKVNDIYYNLDSKLDTPERIGDENKLFEYLENLVKSKDKELFVIIPREIELDGSWRH